MSAPSAAAAKFAGPHAALAAILPQLRRLSESESASLGDALGRVLADPVITDRDSPPCDVTAMDGYAIHAVEFSADTLPVRGEIRIGLAPPPLPLGAAMRIFTGGPIPPRCDAVIQREHVDESPTEIRLRAGFPVPAVGTNIRRRGENLRAREAVIDAGTCVTPAVVAGLASFGASRVRVIRRARVAIIVTGDELLPVDAPATDWQIRDSNGPMLDALLRTSGFIEVVVVTRVADVLPAILAALTSALAMADVVLLTGGVSAGDHDYVPDAVRRAGGNVVFHRLPMRPGGPMLGAVTEAGQPILALPGNPLSTAVTARRIGLPIIRHMAGLSDPLERTTKVTFDPHDGKSLHLWWYRLARLTGHGQAEIVVTKGSGDVVSLTRSDGFVEIPPGESGPGPWPFYAW